MNWEEYRKHAKDVVDFIADYMQNIRQYRVFPDVRPGYMRQLLPDQPPTEGESWPHIMMDIKKLILPGMTHWQSPYMHAYFPALNSPASLMGDMLADAFNCLGFTWASSPACTELEVIVMDWLGSAINLPPCFLNQPSNGKGGGVIQTTASEATFVALLCARTQAIRRIKTEQQQLFKAWQHRQQQEKLEKQQQQQQQQQKILLPQSSTDSKLKTEIKMANSSSAPIKSHQPISQSHPKSPNQKMVETFANDINDEPDSGGNSSSSSSGDSSNSGGDHIWPDEIHESSSQSPPLEEDSEINSRLVAYCSDQAHSSVEKASLIGLVKLRYIESDDQHAIDCNRLEQAIRLDRQLGLVPFFICATLGTTGCCAFDPLEPIANIAAQNGCYVHVDAAYAGAAMLCEEHHHLLDGVQQVHSFAFNPSKWLNVHFDCTALWLRDVAALHRTFNVNPLYLKHEQTGLAIDYMHWQIPLSRRFRALKLWCVLRNFGLEGLRAHIRRSVQLAALFERLLRTDSRFIIEAKRILGLVVFRLNSGNELTELLLKRLNSQGKIHCVPASLKGTYVIRFTVTSAQTTEDDIKRDICIIQAMADQLLLEQKQLADETIDVTPVTPSNTTTNTTTTAVARTPKLSKLAANFGTSLLLCNSPMTPKLVNGSFAAILDNQDVVQEFVRKFGASANWQKNAQSNNNTALRRRIKGLMLSDKQYSLDSRMDLVNSIMASIQLDNTSSASGSAAHGSETLVRRCGSVRERRIRKQPHAIHAIKKLEVEDKSSENSIQEEEEQQINQEESADS